ncbi:MAG: hypothetical protein TECD_01226 [Hyphomicrobiaceae bacterium hypho_1]
MVIKQQAGALVYRLRHDHEIEILLITSKKKGHWSIPKGHVEPGEKLCSAAARETMEEAGVKGEISTFPLGTYVHEKRFQKLIVSVYPLKTTVELQTWGEDKLRRRKWYKQSEAARVVKNSDLSKIISNFHVI